MAPNPVDDAAARVGRSLPRWIGGLGSVLLFLAGVQLLGTATEAAAAPLDALVGGLVGGDARALGVGWLATYLLANGSVVAALAVSLFETGIVGVPQLFLLVAGSRLGAGAIVLLVGALDYLQKRRYTVGEAISLGLLTFLLTHSVYLPATVIGYLALPWRARLLGPVAGGFDFAVDPLGALEPAARAVVGAVGAPLGFVLALLLLFGSLNLFDRVLRRVDTGWLRGRVFRRFRNRWVGFGLGLAITGLTTSVAFSLGVIVPLFNRGYLERREVIPYVLGANLGTLFDTLVVAVVLESPEGVTIVAWLLAAGTVVTLAALLAFRPYVETVDGVQDRLVEDRRYLAAFLGSLVVLPVGLILL